MVLRAAFCSIILLLGAACATEKSPFLEGLGASPRPVTTTSPEARKYFEQGLALCWAFNHDEAVRSFESALKIDPTMAMAHWGIAFALGPNLNGGYETDEHRRRAHEEIALAADLAKSNPNVQEVERMLIAALTARYPADMTANLAVLDLQYSQKMREAYAKFADDPDVATLYADSLMQITQVWRDWPVNGNRGPYTAEFEKVLEGVLAKHPEHIGANHFYIHAVEASNQPGRALPSSDRLGGLAPGAGHLVHMPAHIYIRVGMYRKAVDVNAGAAEADDAYFGATAPHSVYQYYRAHNRHFLIWAAMFEGSRARAMSEARAMVERLMPVISEQPEAAEAFVIVPMHVMMRFGLWEEIIAEPAPAAELKFANVFRSSARAIAFANLGRHEEAKKEIADFERVVTEAGGAGAGEIRNATVDDMVSLARHYMLGETLYRSGRTAEGIAELRVAVEIEDRMSYGEPPGWLMPVRHALGALLLESGRAKEAEAVYRKDLEQHAENGWSLNGLAESLAFQHRFEESEAVAARFREAWKNADTPINASCFCRKPAAQAQTKRM